ncbi:MAG TPA: serine hydrolase [Anaerolineales bacterium]|nr:serine hydrolase [Anaerolineales bacterium]
MKQKKFFVILISTIVALSLLACGSTPARVYPMPSSPATTNSSRLPDPEEVKEFLVQLVDVEKRVPGIVVGMIADDPQERWVVGYGRLSTTDERVPDGDTVFEIASITKVFTGILLAQAVVNGEVNLDDPISMYLPEGVTAPEYEGRSITLLDLATHTAGLPRLPSNNSSQQISNPFADYPIAQMYDFLSGYHLTRAPGSTYEYSNYGFGLLGNLLVRRAGKADYEALLEDRITKTLGMDSTRIELNPEMSSRLATPHSSYSVVTSRWYAPTLAGAGMIYSTANDMLTFLAANMGMTDTGLRPALQLAGTPQRPGEKLAYIGLGWNLPRSGNGIHYHGGAHPGYTSFLAWDSERKIGVVVLMNVYDGPRITLGFPLLRGFPLTSVPVDPNVLAAYVGSYQSELFDVTIRLNGAHIYFGIPGYGEAELIAITENQFYLEEAQAEITFFRNDLGKVDRMVWLAHGETYEGKKVP